MHKLLASIKKEALLLLRDIGGLGILFVMPIILVITITLLQDTTFKKVSGGTSIDILLVDLDKGHLSSEIRKSFSEIPFLNPITAFDGKEITEKLAEKRVAAGDYQLAVVIPAQLSTDLDKQIASKVNGILADFEGGEIENETVVANDILEKIDTKVIKFYFDPITQETFRSSVAFAVDKLISQIETQSIYKAFESEIGASKNMASFNEQKFVRYEEINPSLSGKDIIPNSVQHNVPAWTLFAIFFMILPLSLNLVKEKGQGTFIRLQTTPVSYRVIITAKAVLYVLVSLLQFTIILLLGMYVFPLLELPALQIGNNIGLLYVVALSSGMAAVGLGLLLGTLFTTHEQAAPFGAVLVVILAAIGGVWVPVFAMPETMQIVAKISPMNWGLDAFYSCFVREGGIQDIASQVGLLIGFFMLTVSISILYYEKKKTV